MENLTPKEIIDLINDKINDVQYELESAQYRMDDVIDMFKNFQDRILMNVYSNDPVHTVDKLLGTIVKINKLHRDRLNDFFSESNITLSEININKITQCIQLMWQIEDILYKKE